MRSAKVDDGEEKRGKDLDRIRGRSQKRECDDTEAGIVSLHGKGVTPPSDEADHEHDHDQTITRPRPKTPQSTENPPVTEY
jgi:hypothetical protein